MKWSKKTNDVACGLALLALANTGCSFVVMTSAPAEDSRVDPAAHPHKRPNQSAIPV